MSSPQSFGVFRPGGIGNETDSSPLFAFRGVLSGRCTAMTRRFTYTSAPPQMLPVYLHTARLCQSANRRCFPCRRRGKRNSTPTQTRRRLLCCAAIIPQSDCLHKCRTKKHRPPEPLRHSVSFSARSRNRTRIGRRRAPSDTASRRTQADRPAKPARQRRKNHVSPAYVPPTANVQNAIYTPKSETISLRCRGPHSRRLSALNSGQLRRSLRSRCFTAFGERTCFSSPPVPVRSRAAKQGRAPVRPPLPDRSRSRLPTRLFVRKPLS